jgi:hypothetical protein
MTILSQDKAKNLLVLLALAVLPIYIARPSLETQKGTDFPEFYAAAKIVSAGRGHELYLNRTQDEFQIRYFGGVGTYFNHPPFEILLYLPFAFWAPQNARWLWCVFNLGLLIAVARLLARHVLSGRNWRVVLLFFLTFVPLLLDFIHGQDSVVLLLILVSTLIALRNKQEFGAGCQLACGLFKPHLVLPVLVALLPRARKKFLTGFASVSLALLLLSVEMCGWGVLSGYPRFVWQSQSLPLAGIHPEQMANLRGLVVRLLPHRTAIDLGLTFIGSVLFLGLVARGWTTIRRRATASADLGFANAVLAATLVGYHLSPHDLTVLLLPLTLIFNYILTTTGIPTRTRVLIGATLAIVFLPPVDLFLVREHFYAFASVPILALLLLTYVEIGRSAASEAMKSVS